MTPLAVKVKVPDDGKEVDRTYAELVASEL